jgi:hypothetical protein
LDRAFDILPATIMRSAISSTMRGKGESCISSCSQTGSRSNPVAPRAHQGLASRHRLLRVGHDETAVLRPQLVERGQDLGC